jgi:hypothetical protein
MPHWSADDITALTTDDQLVETFTIDGVANIQGKFDGPSTNISLGMGDVASMTPKITLATSAAPAVKKGSTAVRILTGITYTVTENNPDDTGITELLLRKAP